MTARLADIATRAGVSEATVSRVLNGRPGVADATREAVLGALDVLGYERPEPLRRRSAGLVGLITPELDNPIFPAFAQVIGQALTRRGYTPVLATQTPGGSTEDDLTAMLVDRGVAGIIFLSGLHADTTADHARYARLHRRGVPFVLVNGYSEDIQAVCVSPDEQAAMDLAVGHLTSLGHRRVGLAVGPARFVPARRKVAGFRAAMAAHVGAHATGAPAHVGRADGSRAGRRTSGAPDEGSHRLVHEREDGDRGRDETAEDSAPRLAAPAIAEAGGGEDGGEAGDGEAGYGADAAPVEHSLYTLEGGEAAAGALWDRGCTAVVCASDLMALGAVRAARQRGLPVPGAVSVTGFDDSPLIPFTDPPLTTVRQPVAAMGRAAVRALLEEIGGTPAPHVEYVFLPELVVRGSTAAASATISDVRRSRVAEHPTAG